VDTPVERSVALKQPNRQRRKTRTALINAAQQLFAQTPVEGVTVDDIVGRADVAKGSFYNHFGDKNALADEVYDEIAKELESHICANNEAISDPALRIARALCTVMEYARSHPQRIQALLSLEDRRTNYVSQLNQGLANDVQNGLNSGRLDGVDIEAGVLTVVGLVGVTMRSVISRDVGGSAKALGSAMAACALRALCVEPAEAARLGNQAAADIVD
jgi:AcrR family transcriptional regulator